MTAANESAPLREALKQACRMLQQTRPAVSASVPLVGSAWRWLTWECGRSGWQLYVRHVNGTVREATLTDVHTMRAAALTVHALDAEIERVARLLRTDPLCALHDWLGTVRDGGTA